MKIYVEDFSIDCDYDGCEYTNLKCPICGNWTEQSDHTDFPDVRKEFCDYCKVWYTYEIIAMITKIEVMEPKGV